MFIQKDLRKIPQIIAAASTTTAVVAAATTDETKEPDHYENNDNHGNDGTTTTTMIQDLRLQRRQAEFNGQVKILCQPAHVPALSQLQSLSLYECEISNLDGIGMLTSLRTLSLGRNPLSTIPTELAQLVHLETLWLDDCQLQGALPAPIFQLSRLQELRLSNNRLDGLPQEALAQNKGWHDHLRILALDRNQLREIPSSLGMLRRLETLLLRHNQLTSLPEGVPGISMVSLRLLHLSSNQLQSLPRSLADCPQLTHLYLNSNRLGPALPDNFDLLLAASTSTLRKCSLAHNLLEELPASWPAPDQDGNVVCVDDDDSVMVNVRDNPVWTRQQHGNTDNNNNNNNNGKTTATLHGP